MRAVLAAGRCGVCAASYARYRKNGSSLSVANDMARAVSCVVRRLPNPLMSLCRSAGGSDGSAFGFSAVFVW